MSDFTIGCDPEIFIKEDSGQLKSAIPFIKGTKHKPIMLHNGAGLQHDNVAVEFASPVANDLPSFLRSINISLNLIKKELPFGHKLAHDIAAIEFPEEEVKGKKAKKFGCSPDYNAWMQKMNEMPTPPTPTFRSCGGHIHVGYVEGSGNDFLLNIHDKIRLVKVMDCLHGLLSVHLDDNQGSKERRKLYGGAGCFRSTEYGVEYRTLSNFWIKNNSLISLMYYLTRDAIKIVREDKDDKLIDLCGGPEAVIGMINNNQVGEVTRARVLTQVSNEAVTTFHRADALTNPVILQP